MGRITNKTRGRVQKQFIRSHGCRLLHSYGYYKWELAICESVFCTPSSLLMVANASLKLAAPLMAALMYFGTFTQITFALGIAATNFAVRFHDKLLFSQVKNTLCLHHHSIKYPIKYSTRTMCCIFCSTSFRENKREHSCQYFDELLLFSAIKLWGQLHWPQVYFTPRYLFTLSCLLRNQKSTTGVFKIIKRVSFGLVFTKFYTSIWM